MSASGKCHHPEMSYSISAFLVAGEHHSVLQMRVHCATCGARFRFVGVNPARDEFEPFVNRTATEITLPMVEIA